MRPVLRALLVALLLAAPARAGSILYATAASQLRIDGFCIQPDGSLATTPSAQIPTFGKQPRRVLVGSNGVLYVAERDRIEAFRIGPQGGLHRLDGSKAVADLDPRDLALSPDATTLYVTHQGFLEAFALNADGSLPPEFTSCVQRENTSTYLNAQATAGLLYVSANDAPGRIEVYRLNADGSLPQTGCGLSSKKNRPDVRPPDSARKRIQEPKAFVVSGDFIYVEERALRRILAFRLQPDGTFCDRGTDANGNIVAESCGDIQYFLPTKRCARRTAKKQRQQCSASRTTEDLQYEGLVLHPAGQTLLGTQYFKGRLDAYRLQPEDALGGARVRLPKQPTFISDKNPVMTPVRLTVTDRIAYVAGGELDRVAAYRLNKDTGELVDATPFSRTDEQTNSFPNDVAVAVLSGPCL